MTNVFHGTSNARAYMMKRYGAAFTPLYVTTDRESAEHYAKARTAYDMYKTERDDLIPSIFAMDIPDKILVVDDYNEDKEPNQYKILKPDKYLPFISIETLEPWPPDESGLLRLSSFGVGMVNYGEERKVTKIGKELF